MNLANKLTLSRIMVIPFFVGLLLAGNATSSLGTIAAAHWAALALFVAATVTDYYDGKVARALGYVTPFGALLDPLADKLLTMSAFVGFVEIRLPSGAPVFPAWAVIVILAREFLVTGLRSLALASGRVISADRFGKHKTGWQLGVIIGVLVALSFHDTLRLFGVDLSLFEPWMEFVVRVALAVVVGLTVGSGLLYFSKNRDILRDEP